MKNGSGNLGRLAGEFLVIVVGVLVALAVGDWRDYRNERVLEAHLMDRLEEDLTTATTRPDDRICDRLAVTSGWWWPGRTLRRKFNA